MKKKIFLSGDHWTGLAARIALGSLILPHGLQKAFGLFGGYGFTGTMQYFTDYIKVPWLLGAFIIFTEFIGAVLLIAGYAVRIWSMVIIAIMLGTIVTVHGKNGFFMNWGGTLQGEGYEYHLAIIALSVIVIIVGAGRYSIDRKLIRQ
ncbi:MAG: DoxX family protein [Chitinophagales bacterium]|nr:DoxX family protein [Chitinophagales bacterium]